MVFHKKKYLFRAVRQTSIIKCTFQNMFNMYSQGKNIVYCANGTAQNFSGEEKDKGEDTSTKLCCGVQIVYNCVLQL